MRYSLRLPGSVRRAGLILWVVLSLILATAPTFAAAQSSSVYDPSGSRYFPETNHSVKGAFLDYWNKYGGLSLFGYPVSDPFQEVNADDGKTYTVQYFERNRFESHPENTGNQYEVLLARFGALMNANRIGKEAPFQPISTFSSTNSRVFFKETGHSLSDGFLAYWNKSGGLSIFGYPLSEPFQEVSPTDGKTYTVQYFERNRFEYHPEFKGTQYEVLLGLLGSEYMKTHPATKPGNNGSGQGNQAQGINGEQVEVVLNENRTPTFIAPPENYTNKPAIVRPQTATITVNYTGFTAQAQASFQYAVDIWASQINSPQSIVINANFSDLGKNPAGNLILGSAGPHSAWKNFAGAPVGNTFYAVALANSICNCDLDGGEDIDASFTSNAAASWFFRPNGSTVATPAGQTDFTSVVLHEIGHGLGFVAGSSFTGGVGSWGSDPFIYFRFLRNGSGQTLVSSFANNSTALGSQFTSNNLFFNGPFTNAANGGGQAKIFAPATYLPGSSISHLDESTFNGTGSALMTPSIARGETELNPGPVTLGIFRDMGWSITLPPPIVASIFPTSTPELAPTCNATVTINGANFVPGQTTVKFGTLNATSVNVLSDSQLTAVAPTQARGTVHVTVTTPNGTSITTPADFFTYTPDLTAPATTVTLTPAPNGAGWNKTRPVTVNMSAVDVGACGSGVQKITYSATGAQTIPLTVVVGNFATASITAEGITTLTIFATDLVGNNEVAQTKIVRIDTIPPVTSLTYTGGLPGNNGWLRSPVVVSLSATDGGSGGAFTEYSFNNLTFTPYSAAFPVNNEGITTVYYRSIDVAGNVEATQSKVFKIDTRPPSSTASFVFSGSGVTINYSVTDPTPGSGPAGLHYIASSTSGNQSGFDLGGATGTINLTGSFYQIEYWGEDIAGNEETVHHISRIVVNTLDSDTAGSLRYALNRVQVGETILFSIPGSGPHLITPQTPLPVVSHNNVTVDATSQPGTVCGTELKVVIDGQDSLPTGLEVTGSQVSIFGLNIVAFKRQDLWFNNTTQGRIECNFIGVNHTATANGTGRIEDSEEEPIGIRLSGSAGNHVVGSPTDPTRGNIIAGELLTLIKVQQSPNNHIVNNTLGADKAGEHVLGQVMNGKNKRGIIVQGGANDTLIEKNLIAGMVATNLRVVGSNNVKIISNLIGVTRSQSKGLGLLVGLYDVPTLTAHVLVRGGSKSVLIKDNVFSDFSWNVVVIEGQTTDNGRVEANFIGVNRSGQLLAKSADDLNVPDTVGVWVQNGAVGTAITSNTIVGAETGVQVTGNATTNTQITTNTLGTNLAATLGANAGNMFGVTISSGSDGNLVSQNVIANSKVFAVLIGSVGSDRAVGNKITRNSIYGSLEGGIVLGHEPSSDGTLNGNPGMANRDAARPDSRKITAHLVGGNIVITGQVSAANFNSTIEVFVASGPSAVPQGKTYLASVTVGADGSFSLTIPAGTLVAGNKLVFTSTLTTGDTSAFSKEVAIS